MENIINRDELKFRAWTGDGKDEEKIFDRTMLVYSNMLADGDFERWQKFCYLDKNSKEYREGFLNMMWIFQRFTQFGSPEWVQANEFIQKNYEVLYHGI